MYFVSAALLIKARVFLGMNVSPGEEHQLKDNQAITYLYQPGYESNKEIQVAATLSTKNKIYYTLLLHLAKYMKILKPYYF